MADPQSKEDELAGTEQPFVQHLMELRDRLLKALAAMGVMAALLALYPGPGALYDLLAAPLVAHLPKGATLIATSVISPFMVPLKILLMASFLLALPVILHQAWAFVAPGLYSNEKKTGIASGDLQHGAVFCRGGLLLLFCFWPGLFIYSKLCTEEYYGGA